MRDQTERAMDSVVLNIAEGAGLDGKRGKNHFLISRGSTIEVVGAYDLADAYGLRVPVDEVRRLGAEVASMLTSLAR